MAVLFRAVATLRIIGGDDLMPSEISALLGAEPSHSQVKGQKLPTKSSKPRIARFGAWRLAATDTQPADIDQQVSELLGKLTDDLEAWRSISSKFKIELFCGWFLGSGNEGVEMRPDTLKALGDRGISLGLDIYGPDVD